MSDVNYLGYAEQIGKNNPLSDGLNSIGKTLDDLRVQKAQDQQNAQQSSLRDLQIQQAQAGLADTQAQQGAMAQRGGGSLQDAYVQQQKAAELKANSENDIKGWDLLFKSAKSMKDIGIPDPQRVLFTQSMMQSNPRMAPLAPMLTSISDDGTFKASRKFGEGELKDPLTQKPLPGGYYDIESRFTGDPSQPFKLLSYKATEGPKLNTVAEGAAISDGNGRWTVPAPKADKVEKGFDTIDLGDKIKVVPRDGSPAYTLPKAARPDTVIKLDRAGTGTKKPLPVAALKLQQDAVDAIGTASGIRADLGVIQQQVETGKLKLGPASNLAGNTLNALGMSTENSRNLATFKTTLEKLRNDSLRLNKGVQTDGDAQRAWNELMTNINDPGVVKQRLAEIDRINERAVTLHQANIENVRNNYGLDPLDTSKQTEVKPALGKKPAKKATTRPPLSAIFGQ